MSSLSAVWPALLTAAHLAAALAATLHAVLHKRDSRAVIGWVGLIWLAPFSGSLAYFLLGINRIRRKAVSLNLTPVSLEHVIPRLDHENLARAHEFAEGLPGLRGLAELERALTKKPLLPGHQVQPLENGDEAYPAMIQAINAARHSVALLSYIFDNDRAGEAFRQALLRARDRGVEVRVLIDGVGSRYVKPPMLRRLRKDGLAAEAFLPTVGPKGIHYFNLRNHRKIMVVDGKIGFTGGTNIREGHWLSLHPSDPVQCLHFRITGPAVQHLMEAFAMDWAFATDEVLSGTGWFPEPEPEGPVWARGISDGPDADFEVLENALLGALAGASRRAWIVTPYFLPESALMHALIGASMRGVDVRIVLPQFNNIRLLDWAAPANFPELLARGCRLFLTPPPFDHTKLLLVDGAYSLLGSTNWDPRSLRLNFEYNVGCYGERLASDLERRVERKMEAAHELTLAELESRSLFERLRTGLAHLLMPYL